MDVLSIAMHRGADIVTGPGRVLCKRIGRRQTRATARKATCNIYCSSDPWNRYLVSVHVCRRGHFSHEFLQVTKHNIIGSQSLHR
jgi:hypothetical protein